MVFGSFRKQFMIKNIFYLLLFTTLTVFGQNPLTPEDKIYNAVDAFVANTSLESLQKLDATEKNFWKNPKSKSKIGSLDHRICPRQNIGWNRKANLLSRLAIDQQLKLLRLLRS